MEDRRPAAAAGLLVIVVDRIVVAGGIIGRDWDDTAQAMLPTVNGGSGSPSPSAQGLVKSKLWSFYADDLADENYDSLAEYCMEAVQATEALNPNLPWLFCGHSLGGPMTNLAAMDAVLGNSISEAPIVITFGSLHLGGADFASSYNSTCPWGNRVANLSDFVPALIGLTPGADTMPYVHVSRLMSFVWQTWSDWQNHSLPDTYLETMRNYWGAVAVGTPQFPFAPPIASTAG